MACTRDLTPLTVANLSASRSVNLVRECVADGPSRDRILHCIWRSNPGNGCNLPIALGDVAESVRIARVGAKAQAYQLPMSEGS